MKKTNYTKLKNKEDMKKQMTVFIFLILMTFVAFMAVSLQPISYFVKPFLILIAVTMLFFQLNYFMHMKEKGHEIISTIIYGGVIVMFVFALTFVTIIWW